LVWAEWLALVASLKNVREKTRNKAQKIKNIMDLYQDRKIVHFGTAEKLIKGIRYHSDQ
jgi:hypothetical protein